jgi:hypothetical protein
VEAVFLSMVQMLFILLQILLMLEIKQIGMSSNRHFLSPKNGLVISPLTSLPAFKSSVDGPGRASESPQL